LPKNILVEAHPSLYRYSKKETIDSVFLAAAGQIDKPLTGEEFWRVLQPVIVSIHSGHTNLLPSASQTSWYNKNPVSFLPFLFYVQDDRLFMREKKNDSLTKHYLEVKAVNGLPVPELITKLRKFTPGEGLSNQFANFQLQGAGFSHIYGHVFGYYPTYQVDVEIELNHDSTISLNGVKTRYQRQANEMVQNLEFLKSDIRDVVSVNFAGDIPNTAILKIKNFTYLKLYRSFDEQFFDMIEKQETANLVIDLRGNTGGFDAVSLDLMRYLIDGYCQQLKSIHVQENNITFFDNIINRNSRDSSLAGATKVKEYRYSLRYYDYILGYTAHNFNKKLYILTDKGTFSAAAIFAASLKKQRKLTIVGEETGGAEAGSDGGVSYVRLSNTGLFLLVPRGWASTITNNPKSTHGLMPDVIVKTDLNNPDAVIDKLKELILAGTK
jgi:hypothetical protein